MATGAGVFAGGTWPSIRHRRRNTSGKLLRPLIPKPKLPISASQTKLRAQNDVVLQKDGVLTLKDYFDQCREFISKSDGGPPRWFSPLECASQSKDSPLLLYLPGVDGVGLGLMLHQERLSKYFDIWCMRIPLEDRTSFTELVKFVESAVRTEYSRAPNRPIYIAGESLGGCLALAVAARNPDIDLMLILTNPATSFGKSETLLRLSAFIPKQISSSLPYVLTFLLGTPLKMATSSYMSVLCKAFTIETLEWKLEMLKSAAAFANSQLHVVTAQTLILASGKDKLFPSREEAKRLSKVLPNCKTRVFHDKGHALFLEEGVSLLSVLIMTSFYKHGLRHDYVTDFIPPTLSEIRRAHEPHKLLEAATNPVMLSTLGDGSIVRGLAGIPCEGPVIYVGYHMLFGLELFSLLARFVIEKNILLRGLAHPVYFSMYRQGEYLSSPSYDLLSVIGAVPVTGPNFYRLLSSNSHFLLYPGGLREALHRKGEEYKLFWPEQSEFVRMAAKFGATIVPFGAVGEDDVAHLLFDYDDLKHIPYYKNAMEKIQNQTVNVRKDAIGEIANQDLHFPIAIPKVPGRFYYLFGKPIETKGMKQELMGNREKANELYLEVKSEVENCLSYLKEKRERDPYRNIFARLRYQATHGFDSEVPTFDLDS